MRLAALHGGIPRSEAHPIVHVVQVRRESYDARSRDSLREARLVAVRRWVATSLVHEVCKCLHGSWILVPWILILVVEAVLPEESVLLGARKRPAAILTTIPIA